MSDQQEITVEDPRVLKIAQTVNASRQEVLTEAGVIATLNGITVSQALDAGVQEMEEIYKVMEALAEVLGLDSSAVRVSMDR